MLQLGAALAGVILVTVSPRYRSAELMHALEQSGVAELVHGTTHRSLSMEVVVRDLRPGLPALREVTTGLAKGALLHHLGLVNAAGLPAQRAGFQDGDTWINPIPLFHCPRCR